MSHRPLDRLATILRPGSLVVLPRDHTSSFRWVAHLPKGYRGDSHPAAPPADGHLRYHGNNLSSYTQLLSGSHRRRILNSRAQRAVLHAWLRPGGPWGTTPSSPSREPAAGSVLSFGPDPRATVRARPSRRGPLPRWKSWHGMGASRRGVWVIPTNVLPPNRRQEPVLSVGLFSSRAPSYRPLSSWTLSGLGVAHQRRQGPGALSAWNNLRWAPVS